MKTRSSVGLARGRPLSYGARRVSGGSESRRTRCRGPRLTGPDGESGQGMTEYIIVFISLLVPLFALLGVMRNAVSKYMLGIYSYMSYPFP
jgi:hypothetical protein